MLASVRAARCVHIVAFGGTGKTRAPRRRRLAPAHGGPEGYDIVAIPMTIISDATPPNAPAGRS
jgi:hypothetical protein